MKDFTGKLIITFELDCVQADAEFIEDNVTKLVKNRVDAFLDVVEEKIIVELYSSS